MVEEQRPLDQGEADAHEVTDAQQVQLSQRELSDGTQAWKIVIPTSKTTPEPRAHDGFEWIYVLPGHLRLVPGDRDWVLGPGEVATFDTRVPHWFGSTGTDPAEILSIFGRPGERTHVPTGPLQEQVVG